MQWNNEKITAQNGSNSLHRSVSSFGLNVGNLNTGIREAKSFTGALPELNTTGKEFAKRQHDPNYFMKMLADHSLGKEDEYVTKEASTDKIFLVKHEMLKYRGRQYSLNDIATRWKKDCRMWLWKSSLHRRNRSVSEIRERMQAIRLNSSTDAIPR